MTIPRGPWLPFRLWFPFWVAGGLIGEYGPGSGTIRLLVVQFLGVPLLAAAAHLVTRRAWHRQLTLANIAIAQAVDLRTKLNLARFALDCIAEGRPDRASAEQLAREALQELR